MFFDKIPRYILRSRSMGDSCKCKLFWTFLNSFFHKLYESNAKIECPLRYSMLIANDISPFILNFDSKKLLRTRVKANIKAKRKKTLPSWSWSKII